MGVNLKNKQKILNIYEDIESRDRLINSMHTAIRHTGSFPANAICTSTRTRRKVYLDSCEESKVPKSARKWLMLQPTILDQKGLSLFRDSLKTLQKFVEEEKKLKATLIYVQMAPIKNIHQNIHRGGIDRGAGCARNRPQHKSRNHSNRYQPGGSNLTTRGFNRGTGQNNRGRGRGIGRVQTTPHSRTQNP